MRGLTCGRSSEELGRWSSKVDQMNKKEAGWRSGKMQGWRSDTLARVVVMMDDE